MSRLNAASSGEPVGTLEYARAPGPAGYFRWVICALLFFATTINYIDRQVIGILKPTLMHDLKWDQQTYANVVFWFQAAYAIGLLLAGGLIDRLGTKIGYALALVVWSVAAILHGSARTATQFASARFGLGLGESGNFPAAIKATAEWFPQRERSLATGIFNAGSNIGAVVAPIAVPWLTFKYGWPIAFYATGTIGLLWLALWLPIYRRPAEHPAVSSAELAYIQSDPPEVGQKMSWVELLGYRQTWAFAIDKFLTDPIWWFYLYWIPGFLDEKHHVKLLDLGPPLIVIYLLADIGSIGGGWIPSVLLKRGWSMNAARKTAMLICALAVVPVFMAATTSHLWFAVGLVSLAAAAHQGWSANLFTIVSDTFPKRAVGSVVGIGGMAGAIGGMGIAELAGWVLQRTGSYVPLFIIGGSAYLVALACIQGLLPRLERAEIRVAG